MIQSFRSKALKLYWTKGDASGLRPDWRAKVTVLLNILDDTTAPSDLDLPGFGFHPLTGDRAGTFAIWVSRNWRITFAWLGDDAVDVDLEDYHGK